MISKSLVIFYMDDTVNKRREIETIQIIKPFIILRVSLYKFLIIFLRIHTKMLLYSSYVSFPKSS